VPFFKFYIGTEFKTCACPITGVMRKMEIQRGKDGMKSQQFNQQVGANVDCALRLLLDTIPQDMKTSKHGVRGDSWFGGIKTANEICLRGHKAVLQFKQYHSLFPKEFIESTLKDAPGGVHILLEGTTNDEVLLVAQRYRYSHKTILFFVLTKKWGKLQARRSLPYEVYRYFWKYLYTVC
jgi:hypothetical protein